MPTRSWRALRCCLLCTGEGSSCASESVCCCVGTAMRLMKTGKHPWRMRARRLRLETSARDVCFNFHLMPTGKSAGIHERVHTATEMCPVSTTVSPPHQTSAPPRISYWKLHSLNRGMTHVAPLITCFVSGFVVFLGISSHLPLPRTTTAATTITAHKHKALFLTHLTHFEHHSSPAPGLRQNADSRETAAYKEELWQRPSGGTLES